MQFKNPRHTQLYIPSSTCISVRYKFHSLYPWPMTGESIFNRTSETQPHRYVASLWRIFLFLTVNQVSPPPPPPTPPGETSLHQQNKSVESPWVILMLFTTRFQLRVNSPDQWLWWHRHVVFCWSRSFFLRWITADPSPRGNFTPPTKHECGETMGDLEPMVPTPRYRHPPPTTPTLMMQDER